MNLKVISILAIILAGPAMAQDSKMPVFDGSLLDACIENQVGQGEKGNVESCIGVAAEACMETEGGSSTAGMNDCTGQELDMWDKRLNDAYKDVMTAVKRTDEGYSDGDSSPNRAELLKDMQKSWIAFRDSSCAFEQSEFHGGTMASTVGVGCLLDLTAKRAIVMEGYRDADVDR